VPHPQEYMNALRHGIRRGARMRFSDWEGYYEAIVKSMNYSRDRDEQVAWMLSGMIGARKGPLAQISDLKALFSGRHAYVFADGPTLASDIKGFKFTGPCIAADGATSRLMAEGIRPDVIVTDLDADDVEDQVEANRQGAIVIVHAHGDNQRVLEEWVPKFPGRILATTQAAPIKNVQNFGGFTDGDRAVLLADHFGADPIILVAFNFDDADQEYMRTLGEVKLKKLTWGSSIIVNLTRAQLYFFEDVAQQLRDGATALAAAAKDPVAGGAGKGAADPQAGSGGKDP
jgi:uncharacterized Rossmann fold enzyme